MGASRRAGRAVLVAALVGAGAQAGASVQVEPVVRLSLEGGYDSNVLYDGQGGSRMGRVSPDLGFQLRDHTWTLDANAGGDLLVYPERPGPAVWNQRGRIELHARPGERWNVDARLSGTYAFDPVGLARLGIIGPTGAAIIGRGDVKVGWMVDHGWRLSGLFEENLVRFDDGTGAASHTPGVEMTKRLDPRLEVGGTYRFDYFQGFGAGSFNASAHEAHAVVRWRWTRRVTLEAQGGPTLWIGPTGSTALLPQLRLQLVSDWRGGGARVSLQHGVGLGLLATPGLTDALEVGYTSRLGGSRFRVHADGGLWRSGSIPWGADGTAVYGVRGAIDYRFASTLLVGVAASRFARLDSAGSQFDRNILGLYVTWELRHRRGEP